MISTIRAKIKFHYSLLIFLILSMFLGQLRYAFLFLLIIVGHELGHIFALLIFRGKIEQMNLTIVGGIIDIDGNNLNAVANLIVSISGILMNGLIILMVANLRMSAETRTVVIAYNKLMIAFNLLPVYPLDGSRIIEVFLCLAFDEEYAMDLSNLLSWIFLSLLMIYGMISQSGAIIIISIFLFLKLVQRRQLLRMSSIRKKAFNYALLRGFRR